MRRLLHRGVGLVRYVFTLRGILIVLATALSLAALLADDLAALLGSIAVLLWALILLLSGLRQADLNATVGRLRKEIGTLEPTPQGVVPTVSRPAPYGPSATAPYDVEYARAALLATRKKLALPEAQAQSRRGEPDNAEQWRQTTDPLVSVIVPCFDDARYLQDCLGSVIGQTFEDWECVVVDDGSLDDSAQVIASFANTDIRIRYVRHGVNAGLPAARNTGLRLARGHLVTFLDADDLLAPDSLLDRVEALQDHWEVSEVAGSFCGVRIGSEQTSASSLDASKEWKSPRTFVDFVNGADDCPFPVMAPLVRKSVVVGVGGFDESMRAGGEDWDLWLRILRAGFWFVPSSLRSAIYRQRPESMAKSGAAEHVRQGVALTKRAFGPESPPDYATSHPFTDGLGKYQEQLSVARRAIRSAAMTLVRGNRSEATRCLEVLQPGTWALLDRHLDVESVAVDGVRRSLGLNKKEIAALGDDVAPFVGEIVGQVRSVTEQPAPGVIEEPRPLEVGTLLVPMTGAQLDVMLDSDLVSDDGMAVLMIDRVSGDQGVAKRVGEMDLESLSLNEWWLGRHRARRLVVPTIRDVCLQGIVEIARDLDTEVVVVEEPGTDIMQTGANAEGEPAEHNGVRGGERGAFALVPLDDRFGSEALGDSLSPESVWRMEERPFHKADGHGLERFKDIHAGERVVIVGNGPSLNALDLSLLEGTLSIGVNAIFLATDEVGFRPSYYVVEDTAVMQDNVERIREYRAGRHRFFPSIYRDTVGERSDTTYFNMNMGFYDSGSPNFCVPRFSTDPARRVFVGQSVTIINLQLAYYMGFSEVVLIGMDFSYQVPEDSVVEGNRILSMGDDPNHFHPDYFGKGKVWKDPKLNRVLANYQMAKLMFQADGRRIVNATPGGKLELFPRLDYGRLFPITG